MVCDNCGSGDAVVHLTQIVNNEMSTYHLCEKCAAAKGLETSPDFLAQMGQSSSGQAGDPEGTCDFCGLTFADFRETGRLGCPHCYATFEAQLRGLLRRIHGATQHVGKVYLPPDPSASEMEKRLEGLHRKLQRAVDAEDFERAAELRDKIRALEPAR
jgi:protein arginine kinase activator